VSLPPKVAAPVYSVVVPFYNEAANAPALLAEIERAMGSLGEPWELLMVDDGSGDATWSMIQRLSTNRRFRGIKLSRNRGHQNALLAGLFGAEGDAVVTVDADLQDDITIIEEMVHRFSEGCEIVYGVRKSPVRRIPLSNGAALECTTSSLPGWVSMSFTTMPTSGS